MAERAHFITLSALLAAPVSPQSYQDFMRGRAAPSQRDSADAANRVVARLETCSPMHRISVECAAGGSECE
jgi:hypothetical protein